MSYAWRWITLWLTLWWFALVYAVGRVRIAVSRGDRRKALYRHRGQVLRRMLTRLGATFVKLGQVMATRPDLLDPEIIDELRHLQDRLPPFAFAEVRAIVEADLGGRLEERFAELDPQPVAAASVAQVHRARLADGREVAVKVLRPDIRAKVQRDATILVGIARVIAWHPRWRLSDPVGHLRHFVDGIVEQTDLAREAANYERFRRHFDGMAGVRFPHVLPELSATRVMTMDFIRGTKLDAMPAGAAPRNVARRLQQVILKMCFEDRFVHADLHPGNMLVDDRGDLVIFDVGLVEELGERAGAMFLDLTRCLTIGAPKDFVDHVRRYHEYVVEADWQAMETDATTLLGRFRNRAFAEMEMGALMNDMFAMARTHRVRPPAELALVLVALVTSEGIGKQLDPTTDVFQDVAMYLGGLIARNQVSA